MALTRENRTIAENLLERMSKDEINELIKVLKYFNDHCREDVRHLCLRDGCENGTDQEKKLRELRVQKSQDVYFSTTHPVCKCCGR